MRKFLILVCILIPYCCLGQFFDDFSDTITFRRNNWQGNISHFSIQEQNLRLNNKSASSTGVMKSYLSAPVSLTSPVCWEFEAQLNFNPSSQNNARFYLISDNPKLSQSLNGYFIRLGGTYDEIALCHQQGDVISDLINIPKRLTSKYNTISIRIEYVAGKWKLYSLFNSETEFRFDGECSEAITSTKGYLGWLCNYTKTYNLQFLLLRCMASDCTDNNQPDNPPLPNDTVYIKEGTLGGEPNSDLRIDSVTVTAQNTLLIYFNQPVNISEAFIAMSPKPYAMRIAPTQFTHIIHGTTTPELKQNIDYYLIWNGMRNLNGEIFDSNTFSFIIPGEEDEKEDNQQPDNGEEEFPSDSSSPRDFGDIVISEIMANPKGCTLLPEAEYVELFNRTGKSFSLENCSFYYATRQFKLPAYTLAPYGRVILCNSSDASRFGNSIAVLPLSSFPTLANTGKLLYLENAEGQLLHWIEYSDKWYASSTQKAGGYSLEMADTDYLYSTSSNWSGSTSSTGGTPGKPNSIECKKPDTERPYLMGHYTDATDHLVFKFSKSMNEPQLKTYLSEKFPSSTSVWSDDYPYNRTFIVSSTENGETRLELQDITCIDGLPLYQTGPLSFGTPEASSSFDLCINELLYKAHADNERFIEIYNTSDKLIDLAALSLSLLDNDTLPASTYPLLKESALLAPGSFALIAPDPHKVFARYGYHGTPYIIVPPTFPELQTSSGNIALTDADGTPVDLLFYRNSLHSVHLSDITGVSLERRDPLISSDIAGNWTSGDASTFFATPGYANSADSETVDSQLRKPAEGERFRILNETLRLQPGSPASELVLLYRMEEGGSQLTATLYTSTGLKVCRLAHNILLDQEGELAWTDEWRTSRSDTPGIYLLLIEYHTASGHAGKEKIAVPIVP